MIFYNNQLMPTRADAILYMVSNPIPFSNYDDHEAGIYIQMHELIERAIAEGEDPIMLIEEYLETTYTGGNEVEEIAAFLFQNDKMNQALWTLQQSWDAMDDTLPENSRMYGGIDKKEAAQLYSEITLRSYLDMLISQEN
ncbi:hypothetical protein [uncultured Aquimarina sp.]|uniref:hypothetical protein n=1 Tax=uncultured Aquimarina sp. TaxID=575652 RepID=UPI002617FFBC|nr:hypothetical protein [uncultured Aquimarina sp.]